MSSVNFESRDDMAAPDDRVERNSPAFKPGPRDERGVLAARILAVAREQFSANGYTETSVRAIARAADVDPALVHHYYGSKEDLLRASLQAPAAMLDRIVSAWASPPDEIGAALVRATMANWSDSEASALLRTVLLAAAHHTESRERLRDLIARQLMGPANLGVDEEDSRQRASLIASQLLGMGLARYVWQIEPLASMPDDEVVAAIGATIQRYVNGNLG
jgi:AcrR family transcriptional regulator